MHNNVINIYKKGIDVSRDDVLEEDEKYAYKIKIVWKQIKKGSYHRLTSVEGIETEGQKAV